MYFYQGEALCYLAHVHELTQCSTIPTKLKHSRTNRWTSKKYQEKMPSSKTEQFDIPPLHLLQELSTCTQGRPQQKPYGWTVIENQQSQSGVALIQQYPFDMKLIYSYNMQPAQRPNHLEDFDGEPEAEEGSRQRANSNASKREHRTETSSEIYADYDDLEALWKDEPRMDDGVQQQPHVNVKLQGRDGDETVQGEREIRSGNLQKQGKGLLSSWQTFFCRLTTQKLYFYHDHTRQQLQSCHSFKFLACQIHNEHTQLTLRFSQSPHPVLLRAASPELAADWTRSIQLVIAGHQNTRKLRLREGKREIYWQREWVSEGDFLSTAETGDLVLMQSQESGLQRLVTNSEYDHVGMLVRCGNGQVKVFEANAQQGVGLYDWDHFHSRFHHYNKLAFRKLHVEHAHRQNLQPVLLQFVKRTLGKLYSISAGKLMRKFSDDEESGFFCSELTAKAYKRMGLLVTEKASSRFWPVDFTERGGLVLEGEAHFGRERLVLLGRHLRFSH